MKPKQSNSRLTINRRTIVTLTASEKMNLVAGVQAGALTTSFFYCSGLTCCEQKTVPDPPTK